MHGLTGNLFGGTDNELNRLVDQSIQLLREHEPPGGYIGCFSGGKDSIVIHRLAAMAGVAVAWMYNKTTIDPPDLVQFIKREHPETEFLRPKHGNFFNRMSSVQGFPTRRNRWCCKEYKENAKADRTMIMGVRAEESHERASRWTPVRKHWKNDNLVVSPILQWASDEIWEFIHRESVPYCCLYDEGWHRIGCIGCPMSRRGRLQQFERYPKFEQKWKRSFEIIWNRRTGKIYRGKQFFGDVNFSCWEELWRWWLYDEDLPYKPNDVQIELF